MPAQLIPPNYLLPIVPSREFRSQDSSARPPHSDSDHQINPPEIDIYVSFTSASQQPPSRGRRSLNHGGRISELSTLFGCQISFLANPSYFTASDPYIACFPHGAPAASHGRS